MPALARDLCIDPERYSQLTGDNRAFTSADLASHQSTVGQQQAAL